MLQPVGQLERSRLQRVCAAGRPVFRWCRLCQDRWATAATVCLLLCCSGRVNAPLAAQWQEVDCSFPLHIIYGSSRGQNTSSTAGSFARFPSCHATQPSRQTHLIVVGRFQSRHAVLDDLCTQWWAGSCQGVSWQRQSKQTGMPAGQQQKIPAALLMGDDQAAEAEEKGKERIWNKLHLHAEQFSSAYRGVACSGILKLVSSSLFFNIDTQTGAHDVLSASHLIKKERKIEGRLYNYHHLGLWAACRMCVVCWQYLHGSSGKGMHAGARALGFTFDCILCCPTLCPMRSQSCTVQR